MLLFFSCQELVNNDQQRALTSRTPPRESSKSPTRAVSWVNRLFCSETDCTQMVSRRFVEPVALTEKQVVAAELYCSSFFDVSFRSRLITLMSAVEALLDCPERSSAVLDVVDLLDKTVKEANIDEATKAAMRGSLQWLRQDSIGQTGKILSTRLLAGREYLGKTAPKFFRYCYDLRSQIVHNGQPSDPTVDLLGIANTFQAFVADLLLASFGVSAA